MSVSKYTALRDFLQVGNFTFCHFQEVIHQQSMSNVETGKTKVSLPTLIAIANALSVSVDTLLCDNVITSKIVFEKEAKDILSDCDEYEVRFLVDLMKSAKIAFRKDKNIRNQFQK